MVQTNDGRGEEILLGVGAGELRVRALIKEEPLHLLGEVVHDAGIAAHAAVDGVEVPQAVARKMGEVIVLVIARELE